MTREEAKVLAPIIKAYAEGKTIQYQERGKWYDITGPCFSLSVNTYRIKPEPNYRPFKNREECWQEKIWFAVSYRYEDAFKYYKFPDGTPFGIKED